MAGPLLGGWLTTEYSWQWAFWINLVLGPVAAIGAQLFVPESKQPQRGRGVDVIGIMLSVGTFFSLVFGLIDGRTMGWWSARSPDHDIVAGAVRLLRRRSKETTS